MAIDQAKFARQVAKVAIESTKRLAALSEGMWNQCFCASDASVDAKNFAQSLRAYADELEIAAGSPLDDKQPLSALTGPEQGKVK